MTTVGPKPIVAHEKWGGPIERPVNTTVIAQASETQSSPVVQQVAGDFYDTAILNIDGTWTLTDVEGGTYGPVPEVPEGGTGFGVFYQPGNTEDLDPNNDEGALVLNPSATGQPVDPAYDQIRGPNLRFEGENPRYAD